SVAVRSSATAEDLPSASFAGQQETYLNIQGDEALLEAVKNCWSSLWTPRAMAYRARNNIAPDDVALAVVVQAMAPADPSTSSGQDPSTGSGQAAAGILFTANPTTGARDEVVINAAWGLGEAIVGGQVTPDTIIADKETGTVKQIDVGEKTVMTVPVAGGTAELPVADSLKKARVLSDAQIAELVRLGCEIERHYGAPQDIEWCRAGDRFFIVQTRPITALPPTAGEPDVPGDDDWPVMEKKPAQPFDLWTQSNVGEVWPNPVSPLLWSAITFTLNQSTRFTLQDLHAPYLDDVQITNRFYGRIYYNEGALAYIFNREFGLPGSFLDAAFGTRSSADVRQSGGFHLLRFLRRLPTFLRMTVGRMGTDRELEALFPQVDRWVADFVARNPDERSDNELWEELSTVWVPRSSQVMNLHTAVSASAFATFSMLERLLDRWTGRPELAQDLVTGLSGVYTAEIGAALWEMACELRALGLADLILDSSPADALAQLQKLPEARPVIDRLDAFLQQHGHRCANEAEWLNPRWAEEPAQVIEMVAGYLRAGDEINPVEAEQRQRRRREGAVVWVEGRLDPLRRAIFRRVLEKAQHLTRLRDNGKHYSMKAGFPFVQVYRVIGRRWTERGWLRQPDDIFFMTVPDLERIVEA
ncbi:MAG: PEP/pyruvate-binding domain-containing protein, partial [Anaerolineae bacterium]